MYPPIKGIFALIGNRKLQIAFMLKKQERKNRIKANRREGQIMSEGEEEKNSGNEEGFAELFESYGAEGVKDIEVGAKVKGEIISIGKESAFIHLGAKSDGVVEKAELLNEKGEMPFTVGDTLELYVVSNRDNEIRLSRAISREGGPGLLHDAFEKGIPVDGKVKEIQKGGFNVELMNKRRAFCPLGQIDTQFVDHPEAHVGNTYRFIIIQFEEDGKNLVVSRRELLNRELEAEREKFLQGIAVDAEYEGKVQRILPYGAFVELFPGIDGMVHVSELSWSRVERPEEIITVGETVKVKIIDIEKGDGPWGRKIALSMKRITADPWDTVTEKFHEEDRATGTVTRCVEFGAFVEIAPGIEGLVPISEMSSTKRVLRPQDAVKVGQVVPVVIKEIDPEKRKITLATGDLDAEEQWRSFAGDSGKPLGSLGERLQEALKSKKKR
jgi:small subunit ribosomal protein S1